MIYAKSFLKANPGKRAAVIAIEAPTATFQLEDYSMANNKSALKRIQINERNRLQNRFYKTSVRTKTKKFLKLLEDYKISQNPTDKYNAKIFLSSVYSTIDKACKKNILHKNTAARKKSQLALKLKIC